MAWIEWLKAAILGVIQGITEWLPISSTGHMILADQWMQLKGPSEFVDLFMVVVQLGSILAVLVLYFHKLNPWAPAKTQKEKQQTWSLWSKVVVAVIPTGIAGVLFEEQINDLVYAPIPIAIALIVYGIAFIVIENRKKKNRICTLAQLDYKTAVWIGVFQILALIPGTSRSGSTILGAVLLGCARPVAAEFSFFLAIPVMLGASGLKLIKYASLLTGEYLMTLLIGTVVAFVVSLFAIRFLMQFIQKHTFKPFGVYRIVLGLLILLYFGFLAV